MALVFHFQSNQVKQTSTLQTKTIISHGVTGILQLISEHVAKQTVVREARGEKMSHLIEFDKVGKPAATGVFEPAFSPMSPNIPIYIIPPAKV